jgi:hypothetical protein
MLLFCNESRRTEKNWQVHKWKYLSQQEEGENREEDDDFRSCFGNGSNIRDDRNICATAGHQPK